MVWLTARLGTMDAPQVAVVAVICRDVQVGAGVLDVAMVMTVGMCTFCLLPTARCSNHLSSRDGQQNPGNNLHVSGLSSRVDTRDLEAAFAKIGRVSGSLCRFVGSHTNSLQSRLKRHQSCMTLTLASLAGLAS
jgi:hypothetical protein